MGFSLEASLNAWTSRNSNPREKGTRKTGMLALFRSPILGQCHKRDTERGVQEANSGTDMCHYESQCLLRSLRSASVCGCGVGYVGCAFCVARGTCLE